MKILDRKGAKATGAARYFTGKPCKRGHVAERYTSTGQCTACVAEHGARWGAANPDKRRAIHKKYRAANRDKRLSDFKNWHAANRESVLARQRNYRSENRQKLRGIHASYAARNAAAIKAKYARRRATERMANRPFNVEFMRLVEREAFDLSKLRECATGIKWHVDHIVPLRSKVVCGLHNEFNLAVIPAISNLVKGNRVWPDMP